MQMLKDFSRWMNENSQLADSSIYKYTRAVNTISNEMMQKNIINKSFLDMSLIEMDIAMLNIFNNAFFIRKNAMGNNMYSNALKQFRYYMLDCSEEGVEEISIVQSITESKLLNETEKQAIIKARKGQGKFRKELLEKYERKCIVTGVDNSKMLVASHIKPWAICENFERIDVENGLLLSPNMDCLFDSGLITFTNEGKMLVSSFVGKENALRLHVSNDIIVDLRATNRLLKYLEYHRDILFVK